MGSVPNEENVKLGPPPRWLKCPRKGTIVGGIFLPLKTPLCHMYDSQVKDVYRFTPEMVFTSAASMTVDHHKVKIGLWIDLTNTGRFYRKEEVEEKGARYYKLNCRGYGECPSEEQTQEFVETCQRFLNSHQNEIIAVHCTHGFNRTGFLISAYLVSVMNWSLDRAVRHFAEARPPGIYKQGYLTELFSRLDFADEAPTAPELPDWCEESEPTMDDNEAEVGGRASTSREPKKIPVFDPPCKGIEPVLLHAKVMRLQQRAQEMCGWARKGFPGSQPVSMDRQNMMFLTKKLYKVSWKADGVRYLMLIDGENEVYMFDRDNNVFHVADLTFPHRKYPDKHLSGTLVDGEMIVDEVDDQHIVRFLIYDVIKYDSQDVGKCDFDRRLLCIKKEIIETRLQAMMKGTINKAREPFSVRLKDFWDINQAEKLLSAEFQTGVKHEVDGLIFQPAASHYHPGRFDELLKWKPHHLNSVDFKLVTAYESGEGMLKQLKGYLYVLHHEPPFGQIKMTKELKQYEGKIIECSFENNQWKFMRERKDKSFPNAFNTAMGVCESIRNPVTSEMLFKLIKERAVKPKGTVKPNPSNDARESVKRSNGTSNGIPTETDAEGFKRPVDGASPSKKLKV